MWSFLASLIGGPLVNGLIGAYKAKLEAGNTAEKIASDLATRELAVEQREQELKAQLTISEEGRWWTALPRAAVTYLLVFYIADHEFGWKITTDGEPLGTWFGWIMATWFVARSGEKVARIIKR